MPKLTNEDKEYILANYTQLGGEKCAEILKVDRKAINDYAFSKNLKICQEKKREIRRVIFQKLAEKRIDSQQFLDIKTKEVAYILGILWADGYISYKKDDQGRIVRNAVNMTLVKDDFEQIKEIFLKTGDWNINYTKPLKYKEFGKLEIASEIIVKFLIENDYKIKSYASPDKILLKIPENLRYYWWRGYLDGDGCFYASKDLMRSVAEFSSTYEQDWAFIENLCKKLQLEGSKSQIQRRVNKKNGNKCSSFSLRKRRDIIKLGNYIYQEYDGLGFSRKFNKFQSILKREAQIQAKHQDSASSVST